MIANKYCLGYMSGGTGTVAPFDEVFEYSKDILKEGIQDVDAIVLWGGEDISPKYYNQKHNSKNQCWSGMPSERDKNEWKAMLYAKANDIPIIGVCRGAQFLCAFAGGSLIQHVDNHGRSHMVSTSTGKEMETSSCHHQMMYPFKVQHKMLAWSNNRRSSVYEDGDDLMVMEMLAHVEPEVVYFPKVKGLAIQGHPEWMDKDDEFVKYCNELVLQYLMVEETVPF